MATLTGLFKPKNPKKYRGNVKNIVYRSSWELKMMMSLDKDPNVIEWSSEEHTVSYKSPVDRKWHRYFPDMIVTKIEPDKSVQTYMIEIKPKKQTQPPKKSNKRTKSYINEVNTWGVNQAKWTFAEEYCKKKGWKFVIMTEKELGIS